AACALGVAAEAALDCGGGAAAGLLASGRAMSMLPLKYAPSSITMRAVLMSPTSFASLRISILSDASTLPWMVPSTTTSRAFTPACSLPFGPTVRRCSCSSTEPSISPSIVRSSRLKIWPLIMTDFPMIAGPRESVAVWLGVGLVDTGTFSLAWLADGAGAEAGLGGYSSSLRLFHIKGALLGSLYE